MREFEKSGMQLLRSTDDLHRTDYGAKNVTTEYEDKFKTQGKKINYCMVMVSPPIRQNSGIPVAGPDNNLALHCEAPSGTPAPC